MPQPAHAEVLQHGGGLLRHTAMARGRWVLLGAAFGVAACSAGGGEKGGTGFGGTSAGGTPGAGGAFGTGGTTVVGQGGTPGGCSGTGCGGTPVCGDRIVGEGEQCEDGNTLPSDGCNASCQLEPGYLCPAVGLACIAKECGDALIIGTEQCDDDNAGSNDGCSSTCRLEPGFACAPGAPTVCHRTTCGDGTKEGFEQCDDGNRIPYDGCSPTCTIEPKCTGGTCTAVCGDGLVFPQEACDDGNTTAGDGCDAACALESGFTCQTITLAPPTTLTIPILYRDMLYANTTSPGPGHPDFESYGGSGATTGLVQTTLDATGKPLASGTGLGVHFTSTQSFFWWFHDQECPTPTSCTPNPYPKLVYLDKAGNPTTLTLIKQGATSVYQYSNPTFFPVNELGWGTQEPAIPFFPPPNNFSFTSELRYQFTYAGGEVLTFTGDDDVWVFINGKLAVDLGGLHPPASATVTLDATAAANLGLTVGGMYEIALFQAERHTNGSSYALSLSGFVHAITECTSLCGDGVIAGTEVCDDGKNDGSYGSCTADCRGRGPYCGDGIVTAPEECDANVDCTPACLFEIIR